MRASCLLLVLQLAVVPVSAEDSKRPDDVSNERIQLKTLKPGNYFLVGAKKPSAAPKSGYGLVVILPGGDGSEKFNGFVQNIFRYALDKNWLVAQPVAIKWTPEQRIVWPKNSDPVAKKKFSTERYVDAVIADVKRRKKVNPKKVHLLAWSSSGPAAYAIAAAPKRAVKAFYVAMSVYRPLPKKAIQQVKGTRFVIDHSPQDRTCPYWMARKAHAELTKAGAVVKFLNYRGGHGWRDAPIPRLRKGLQWLAGTEKGDAPGDVTK